MRGAGSTTGASGIGATYGMGTKTSSSIFILI